MADLQKYDIPIYSRPARRFHWWVALFVVLQIPLGIYMKWRGDDMPGVNDKGEPVKGTFNGIVVLFQYGFSRQPQPIDATFVAAAVHQPHHQNNQDEPKQEAEQW